MVNRQHFGLYFTPEHVAYAQKHREEPPFDAVWRLLREREEAGVQGAQWCGLRYRFEGDDLAAEQAIKKLLAFSSQPFDAEMTYLDALNQSLIEAHAFEMVRDHPAMDGVRRAQFLEAYSRRIAYVNEVDYSRSYVEQLRLALANLVAGIVMEDDARFDAAVAFYQQVVREDIHPQGYILKAVEARDGGGLLRQLVSVASLTLMAEAATHAGVDLWSYSYRGVSLMTACMYLVYYYFYPEKWLWDDNVTNEPYREYGGFLEIANRRAGHADIQAVLDELRPIYDPAGGGLTTLTHGVVKSRAKLRLFGREIALC